MKIFAKIWKMAAQGIRPEEMTYYRPLEMPDYKQATAVKDGNLFILSSHFFDENKRMWEKITNLQVIHPLSGATLTPRTQ